MKIQLCTVVQLTNQSYHSKKEKNYIIRDVVLQKTDVLDRFAVSRAPIGCTTFFVWPAYLRQINDQPGRS